MANTMSRLLATASTITLTSEALEQTVSWSSTRQEPVSLREFVAARTPAAARAALAVSADEAPREQVKRVTELDEDELRQMVVSILERGSGNSVLAFVGEGSFAAHDLAREVMAGTALGERLIAATKRHVDVLEGLIEANKVAGLTEGPPTVMMPEFDF